MNVDLLKRVADVILARPHDFDMDDFEADAFHVSINKPDLSCGTVACIGGWAATLAAGLNKPVARHEDFDYYAGILSIRTSEREIDEAERLFMCHEWPQQYRIAYYEAKTDQERAQVAYDRIHHFIATDGQE